MVNSPKMQNVIRTVLRKLQVLTWNQGLILIYPDSLAFCNRKSILHPISIIEEVSRIYLDKTLVIDGAEGAETLLLNSVIFSLALFFFLPMLKKRNLEETINISRLTYSVMKLSSSNSAAVALLSGSGTKHLFWKSLALSDISSGIGG